MDFIKMCIKYRILLAIYPPHSTHTLQPLNVLCFSPLAGNYSKGLTDHLHTSQGSPRVLESARKLQDRFDAEEHDRELAKNTRRKLQESNRLFREKFAIEKKEAAAKRKRWQNARLRSAAKLMYAKLKERRIRKLATLQKL